MNVSFSRTGPPLSVERLREVAGPDLPTAYETFMLDQNGGVLAEAAHLPGDDSGASIRAFLIADAPDELDGYGLDECLATYQGRYPEGFLPIAVDASSNLALLDIGYEQPGSIWFWDHEREADDAHPARTDNITKIAPSFGRLLNGLTTGLIAEERDFVRTAASRATGRKGPYQPKKPFTFGGRPAGE